MVDEPLWHIGRTASLRWAKSSCGSGTATVFHAGNGQTFAVNPLGLALLQALERNPLTQAGLFDALIERSLLPRSPEGARQLSQALRQLHSSAIINRAWQDDPRGVA